MTAHAKHAAALPVGTVVRDRREHVWVRRPRGWQGVGRGGYTTSAELTALGPLVRMVEEGKENGE